MFKIREIIGKLLLCFTFYASVVMLLPCVFPVPDCSKNPSNWLQDCGFESPNFPNNYWKLEDSTGPIIHPFSPNTFQARVATPNNNFFRISPVQGKKSFVSGFVREQSVMNLCQDINIPIDSTDTADIIFNYRYAYNFLTIDPLNKNFEILFRTFYRNGNLKQNSRILEIKNGEKSDDSGYLYKAIVNLDFVGVTKICFYWNSRDHSNGELFFELDNVVLKKDLKFEYSLNNPGISLPGNTIPTYPVIPDFSLDSENCKNLPSVPNKENYCLIDSLGNVNPVVLTKSEFIRRSNEKIFPVLFRYPDEENGIPYTCTCRPNCQSGDTAYASIGLNHNTFSFYKDNLFHYCVAVRKHALHSKLCFRNDRNEEIRSIHCCESTQKIDKNVEQFCNGWYVQRDLKRVYRHECYKTYCVDAKWADLSKFLEPKITPSFVSEISGTAYVTSLFENPKDQINDPEISYGSPHPWTITQCLQPKVVIDGNVINRNKLVLENTLQHSYLMGFSQGFDSDGLTYFARIEFETLTKKPMKLVLLSSSSVGLSSREIKFGEIPSINGCYGTTNSSKCIQRWFVDLTPAAKKCKIDQDINLSFQYICHEKFLSQNAGNDRSYKIEKVVIPYESSDWCKSYGQVLAEPPKVVISAFNCNDCGCPTWDIDNTKDNANFEISVDGNEDLNVSSVGLNSFDIRTNCPNLKTGVSDTTYTIMDDGQISQMGKECNFRVDTNPTHTCSQGAKSHSTIKVSLDLVEKYFNPHNGRECGFEVFAKLDVAYNGKRGYLQDVSSNELIKSRTAKTFQNYIDSDSKPPSRFVIYHKGNLLKTSQEIDSFLKKNTFALILATALFILL